MSADVLVATAAVKCAQLYPLAIAAREWARVHRLGEQATRAQQLAAERALLAAVEGA